MNKLKLKDRILYLVERLWPLVGATGSLVAFIVGYDSIKDPSITSHSVLSATTTAAGTLLGFFFTVTTIITAIPTRRMRVIRENKGHYRLFLSYLKLSIWLNIAVVTVGLSEVVVRPVFENYALIKPYNSMAIFLCAWSWAASIRFASIFIQSLYDKSDIS
jgi:hypothetical protein